MFPYSVLFNIGENLQVDWFMTAGNHDYFQDICPQIEYTDESDRWEYPAKHYAASFSTIDGVTMDLIMVDSVDLAGTTNLENWRGDPFNPLAYVANPKFEEKWHWIERKMKQSHAQYLFVGTHYPVYSVCKNGNVALMEKRMKPLVQKYGAHLMSGHDHCLEHIEEKGVHYFVSGIGSECCYEGSNLGGVADGALQWYLSDDHGGSEVTGGFTSFVLTSTSMEAVFYVQNGTALYRTGPIFPREM